MSHQQHGDGVARVGRGLCVGTGWPWWGHRGRTGPRWLHQGTRLTWRLRGHPWSWLLHPRGGDTAPGHLVATGCCVPLAQSPPQATAYSGLCCSHGKATTLGHHVPTLWPYSHRACGIAALYEGYNIPGDTEVLPVPKPLEPAPSTWAQGMDGKAPNGHSWECRRWEREKGGRWQQQWLPWLWWQRWQQRLQ